MIATPTRKQVKEDVVTSNNNHGSDVPGSYVAKHDKVTLLWFAVNGRMKEPNAET